MHNLNVALALAAAGIPVFPAVLKKKKDGSGWDKIPAVAKGQNWREVATTDQDQIRAWWRERPECVPGIPQGRIGLVVLDPDRHQGAEAPDGVANFADLSRRLGGFPPHPVTDTPSGGEHHIFRQPPGEPLGNGEGDLPDGINVRGFGGWIVAPGAIRPDGAMWQTKPATPSLIDAFVSGSIPVIPDSLVAIIGQPTSKRSKPARNPEGLPAYLRERKRPVLCLQALAALAPDGKKHWARKKLENSAKELAATPKGARGSTLNAIAYSMGRVVARGWVRTETVFDALWGACEINGLIEFDGPKKVESIINKGIDDGISNPREDLPALPNEKKTLPRATSAGLADQRGNTGALPAPDAPHEPASKAAAFQPSSEDILIDELASLSIIAYDRRRTDAAKQLGIGVTALDKAVKRRRTQFENEAEEPPLFSHWTVEPWPEPVDGDALIFALMRRIQSHVVMIPEAALTVALWIIFSWVHADAAIHSPILLVTSPEAECGKTTLLGLIGFLVRRALSSVGISPAVLYRSIEKWQPTIMIDEADDAFVQNEELRGVVNSGWTRGIGVFRCVGDDNEPRLFSTFCPKAIGLKGKKLPDTTASRAIVIELKRKLDDEKVADFRHVDDPGLAALRRQLSRWANDNVGKLLNASPTLPHGFANRVAANWSLPLAIADAAGGEWPEKARAAAAFVAKIKATLDASIGIQLLGDIRIAFGSEHDCLFSKRLIDQLIADTEKPWGEYNRGKPMTQKQLANRLRVYGIASETVWIGRESAKGYKRAALEDVWKRYL
jgi:hypothetical protein